MQDCTSSRNIIFQYNNVNENLYPWEDIMQTANQVPQPTQPPIYPQYPPIPPIPANPQKSNGLIKASFTIGLILFIIGLVNFALSSWLPLLLMHRFGWSSSMYGLFVTGIQLLVFFIPGLIGFILGIVGFRRMIKENPPHHYFMAVAGIAMCFAPSLALINILLTMATGAIINITGI